MPTQTTTPKKLRPSDFNIGASVDMVALTKGDTDVTKVIASFEATSPGDATVLGKLLELGRDGRLAGQAGHQDKATLGHQFPQVKVHWVSARLDGTTYSFLGVIDAAAADEKRWVKAGRLHVEPFLHGHAASLDLMPMNRAVNGVPAVAATDDDSSGDGGDSSDSGNAGDSGNNGDSSNSDDATGNSSSASGEMDLITAAMSQPGLTKVGKSITPMGQDMGEYLKPIGYDSNYTNAKSQDTSTSETMSGLPTRRRSI